MMDRQIYGIFIMQPHTILINNRINNLGPERYNHHQSNAWKILENEPSAPDEEIENLQEFTTEITA
jgi:hypothetical protein